MEKSIEAIVNFDLFQKMKALDNRREDIYGDAFGVNSCCDYLDSLVRDGDRYGVTMFVEPYGDITKWGTDWNTVMDWWIAVFKSQPKDWDYCKAGWHIGIMDWKIGLPENPEDCWKAYSINWEEVV